MQGVCFSECCYRFAANAAFRLPAVLYSEFCAASVDNAKAEAHDGRTEVSISLCFTLREPSAAVTAIYDRSYHGNIKEDAKECFVSFPGKFTSGWDVLIRELNRNQSVACVFLQTPEEGLGQHLPDPEHPERCHCHKIYGVEILGCTGIYDNWCRKSAVPSH